MAEVHQFPDSMQRAWRTFAEALSAALRTDGAASEIEIAVALEALKPVYLKAAAPVAFKIDPNDREAAVREVDMWVYNMTHMLLTELAVREIKLHRLRTGD